jgi:hypothetical protein
LRFKRISLDFVMGLPPSEGNTAILAWVDWFSKAAHFIPLPKLPSAKEMAQLMVQHVFRILRFPVDIVSDRGAEISCRFWKAFGTLIELSASLYPFLRFPTQYPFQTIQMKYTCGSLLHKTDVHADTGLKT